MKKVGKILLVLILFTLIAFFITGIFGAVSSIIEFLIRISSEEASYKFERIANRLILPIAGLLTSILFFSSFNTLKKATLKDITKAIIVMAYFIFLIIFIFSFKIVSYSYSTRYYYFIEFIKSLVILIITIWAFLFYQEFKRATFKGIIKTIIITIFLILSIFLLKYLFQNIPSLFHKKTPYYETPTEEEPSGETEEPALIPPLFGNLIGNFKKLIVLAIIIFIIYLFLNSLRRENVKEHWAHLIENGQGKGEEVLTSTEILLKETDVWLKTERKTKFPGVIRGVLGVKKDFLVITDPWLGNYEFLVNARDYGKYLDVSYYLMYKPTLWDIIVSIILFFKKEKREPKDFRDLDLFQLRDLHAHSENIKHCSEKAVNSLKVSLDQRPLEIKARGFFDTGGER
ncbi:MAG: hypothetical protein AB1297_03270 [bacterium]